MSVIADIRASRQQLADVLDNEEYSGIRLIVEELYPDQAHFLFELLQNAQDARATEARFELHTDKLIFEHDGRPFSAEDIKGITNIGKGTKASDEDAIGRFGVGFKAVFAYSETPRIFSPTFSFFIESLVLPKEIEPPSGLGDRTRFEFPFNNPKKERGQAFEEIVEGLTRLGETSLLFLSSLASISWTIKGGDNGEVLRFQHSAHHIEILREANGEATSSCHFLRFDEQVSGLPHQSVSVAYPLRLLAGKTSFDRDKTLAEQMKIALTEIGQVSVFFPAEKESSGLRFHLHAPFVPELSRASVKETPANVPLFDQLAHLCASTLHEIRDLGLLNSEALGVLPNKQDSISKRYLGIRDAIITELNEKPLTPTHGRSHAPAKTLFQSKVVIKNVISDTDLAVLIDEGDDVPKWAASAPQKNSNADRMISSLEIREWSIDDLVSTLNEMEASYPWETSNLDVKEWLVCKPNDWLQKLYSLFQRELTDDGGLYDLRDCPIVKLRDGTFAKGKGSYFPSGDGDGDGFPRVDPATYQSGKSKPQQGHARKFLEEIGVGEVDEKEMVKAILRDRYGKETINPDGGDLHRFMKFIEDEPGAARIFQEYHIFEIIDGRWAKPGAVFLDTPFVDTGLRSFYGAECKEEPYPLAERYTEERISHTRFLKFAKSVGAKTELGIVQINCYSNPEWSYLSSVGGERSTSPINQDYCIEGFDDAVGIPCLPVSKLIWATLNSRTFSPRYLLAKYQKSTSRGSHTRPSQLVHQLKNAKWVPQTGGAFVRPRDAHADQLPSGFPYDVGKEWLKSVEFGVEAERQSENAQKKKAVAVELGFEDENALADAQWFASLNPEERRNYRDDFERNANVELPEQTPKNPERRAGKVGEQAESDPDKQSEKRTRSVQVGQGDVKEEAGQYLRRQYTNGDGEMICQACQKPLPFKLGNGQYYFEKVVFLRSLLKHHHQNHLVLCPNHAAMFKHAHDTADILLGLLADCEGTELEITLAGEDEALYFTETHLVDIRAIIDSTGRGNKGG